MSASHGGSSSIATQPVQSLPSFAQAFSNSTLDRKSPSQPVLPPIQPRPALNESRRVNSSPPGSSARPTENDATAVAGKKRSRTESGMANRNDLESDNDSPRLHRVKEEPDADTDMSLVTSTSNRPPIKRNGSSNPQRTYDSTIDDSQPVTPSTPAGSSPVHKKRRVTISGGVPRPGRLNTDVSNPSTQPGHANSTPISPAVMGFTVDNPSDMEQVRSMLSVKQRQKALIEQRRGSVAGIMSPTPSTHTHPGSTTTSSGAPPSIAIEDRASAGAAASSGGGKASSSVVGSASASVAASGASTRSKRSPNGAGNNNGTSTTTRRAAPSLPASSNSTSKATVVFATRGSASPPPQAMASAGANAASHPSLNPPPPISIARRRATQLAAIGKKRPADILISPREAQTPEQFAPSIQSAPPIPHAHAGSGGFGGRFQMSMTLPRLPSVLAGGEAVRRTVGGNVPPTPTRLGTMREPAAASGGGSVPPSVGPKHPIPGISGRSPPTSTIAISSAASTSSAAGTHPHHPHHHHHPIPTASAVPATPSALHHPNYTNDKSAFLAPFEMFYDALNDSKQLKNWLGEQLQRSNALVDKLNNQYQQQEEKMNERISEIVDAIVERRMRAEMAGLYRRIEDLEEQVRETSANANGASVSGFSARRGSFEAGGVHGLGQAPGSYGRVSLKGKQPARNGPQAPVVGYGISEGYTFPPPHAVERERRRAAEHEREREREREREHGHYHERERERDRDRDRHRVSDIDRDLHGMDVDPDPSYESRRMSLTSSSSGRLEPPSSAGAGRPSIHRQGSDSSSPRTGAYVPGLSPPMAFRDAAGGAALPPPGKLYRAHSGLGPGPGSNRSPRLTGPAAPGDPVPAMRDRSPIGSVSISASSRDRRGGGDDGRPGSSEDKER